MGEHNETESTRGDEPVTGQQQAGSPGQEPEAPRTQPDLDSPKKDDPSRKGSDEEDLADRGDPEEPEKGTAVTAPGQANKSET
jgi:hypothetical protein